MTERRNFIAGFIEGIGWTPKFRLKPDLQTFADDPLELMLAPPEVLNSRLDRFNMNVKYQTIKKLPQLSGNLQRFYFFESFLMMKIIPHIINAIRVIVIIKLGQTIVKKIISLKLFHCGYYIQ